MKKCLGLLLALLMLCMTASAEEELFRFEQDGKYGFATADGTVVVEPQFSFADIFLGGYAFVKKDDKCGYIDASGNFALQPIYESVGGIVGGVATFSENGLDGLVAVGDIVLLAPAYDNIVRTDDGSYRATRDGKDSYFVISDGKAVPLATVESTFSLDNYYPNSGEDVADIGEDPTLVFRTDYPLPRLDGATALFPTYSALAQMLYPEDTVYQDVEQEGVDPNNVLITCTKTNAAYDRLIAGECDVIFCAGPSDAQIADAAAAGVEFKLTPFGSEAFVFFVNKNNPLENITIDQIQRIYSGKITDWSKLGVDGIGEIVAYQRPANSGSQTALERLMGDVPLAEPPGEITVTTFMDTIINVVEYRNYPNAIGYSFRFFLSEMMDSDVKMLSIEGVAPTEENIRAGVYPIASTLYAVTRKGESNPNVAALLAWLQSDQGARLIQASGYTPVY